MKLLVCQSPCEVPIASASRPVLALSARSCNSGGAILRSFVFSAFALMSISTLTCAQELLPLVANFNDKTPGMPIGTGGAALGEPTSLANLSGIVTQRSSGQNYLLVNDDSGNTSAKRIRWQLRDDSGVQKGALTFAFAFTPRLVAAYSILVREPNSSVRNFLNLTLQSDGMLSASDEAGAIQFPATSFAANVPMRFVLRFDQDTGTSSVSVNGVRLFGGRAHGISSIPIGRLLIGYQSPSSAAPFELDDIHAMVEGRGSVLLDANFDDKPLGAPIGTGGAAVGEPISLAGSLLTEIGNDGFDGRWLRLISTNNASSSAATWQWLGNAEITQGLLMLQADMRFPARDNYRFTIREAGGNAVNFPSLLFAASGNIFLSDGPISSELIPAVTYNANQTYRLRVAFNLSARHFSMLLDDVILTANRPIAVQSNRGIGRFLTSFAFPHTTGQPLIIDQLLVQSERLFFDGFE